jgi:S-adenosylmethionine:tRNA ribosyltransferase-isomerase
MTLLLPTTRFASPEARTAPAPPESRGLPRDGVRLLVARPDRLEDAVFRDLPDHLRAGDLVVVNNSATVPGEADGLWRSQAVVVHVATPLDDGTWVVELRTAPAAARAVLTATAGDEVDVAGERLTLLEPYPHTSSPTGRGNRLWRARAGPGLRAALARFGRPISYGYLDRRLPLADYQTVFATVPGSAEMPSAGRPFTADVVARLVSRGVAVAPVTLHTGVSSQEVGEAPQPERYDVPELTARLVNATRAAGGRVIALGTTATRALESSVDGQGRSVPGHGWTERVVTPDEPPRVVDGLITGWHDPMASHLLLVEAVAGPELTQAAYDEAGLRGYLWHEFGDSALLLPTRP